MFISKIEKYKAKMCGYYASMERRPDDVDHDVGFHCIKTSDDATNWILEAYYHIGYLQGKDLIAKGESDAGEGKPVYFTDNKYRKLKEEIAAAFDCGMQAAFAAVPPFPKMDDFLMRILGDKFEQKRVAILEDAWDEGYDAGLSAMDGTPFESVVEADEIIHAINSYKEEREKMKNGYTD